MTNKKFSNLFGQPVRNSEKELLTQFHMDIAASIQKVTEEIVLKLSRSISKEYNTKNLCLAGGVALNCVANGKIFKEKIFDNIWIQPAAGDSGGSLGAALAFWHHELSNSRKIKDNSMKGSYLGPEYNDQEIEEELNRIGGKFNKLNSKDFIKIVAKKLSENKTVGWFQGRMEFGPRALGARSILANPKSDSMQKELNLKIKFRESFRPFAPSVLREKVSDWFELNCDSPYMLLVADVKKEKQINISEKNNKLFGIEKLNLKRSEIPAVTHVDYSARVQTVHKETNQKYYDLLCEFERITGCPVLVNTSFNVRGEPIVCSIEDAFNCFMGTNLDILAIGNFILYKEKQNEILVKDYKNKFKQD